MPLYIWSKTASNNGNVDPTINYQEGQAPSTLNDSARALMARVAEYRDDLAGANITSTVPAGASNVAFYLFTNQGFDSFADMDGKTIAFTPNVTNGDGAVVMNVDNLGGKPLRVSPNVELSKGVIVAGTPYTALYNNTDGAFYLAGYYNHPALTPLGGIHDYAGASAPSTAYALCAGQSLSRTTYAALFALIGTTYGAGAGDGLTFSLPDLRGRVTAAPDNMGGTDAQRLAASVTGGIAANRLSVGGVGGEAAHVQTVAEMPSHGHGVNDPGHVHNFTALQPNGQVNAVPGNFGTSATSATAPATTGISIQNTGSGNAMNNVQPTILLNKIIRIL